MKTGMRAVQAVRRVFSRGLRIVTGWKKKDTFATASGAPVVASLEGYDSDEPGGKPAEYYEIYYRRYLGPLRWKRICLLELGIHRGSSLAFWKDFLPLATVAGVDIRIPEEVARRFLSESRVHCFEGDQADCHFLSSVAEEVAKDGFDVIIDDASHLGVETKVSFWHLFSHHLKPGGLYFIEDWGTGYLDEWPDGRGMEVDLDVQAHTPSLLASHTQGMVGFVKQLVDEQGAYDATRRNPSGAPGRGSYFRSMTIYPGVVVIEKT